MREPITDALVKWLLVGAVAIFLLSQVMLSLAMSMGGVGSHMGGPMMGMIFVPLMMALFIIITYAGYKFVVTTESDSDEQLEAVEARELREQYVAGKISEREFERQLEEELDLSKEEINITDDSLLDRELAASNKEKEKES